MTEIKIYPPGTKVIIGDSIPAEINNVTIHRDLSIMYFIEWWSERELRTGSFTEYGFWTDQAKNTIGFR